LLFRFDGANIEGCFGSAKYFFKKVALLVEVAQA
jgi:hypothetical protein